ncbi:hypothetical protein PanWU01x14_063420, partial [Parasponia andersonii]
KIARDFYASLAANEMSSGGGDGDAMIVQPPAIDCRWWQRSRRREVSRQRLALKSAFWPER